MSETSEHERMARLRKEVDAMPGFKQRELQNCLICDRGVAHNQDLDFYRINLERFFIDPGAVQRAHGLELMLGGEAAVLASWMGPDDDIAKMPSPAKSFLICSPCAMGEMVPIASLAERLYEREET